MTTNSDWLQSHPGPLSIELSSMHTAIRLTSVNGDELVASGVIDAIALLATAAPRKLWAADAAEQERQHRSFFAALEHPRIWCARTVDRVLAPEFEKPGHVSGAPVARLLKAHSVAPAVERQHAMWVEDEDRLWRVAARRGYRIDTQLLTIERQSRHRQLAEFSRVHGGGIRLSRRRAWLDERAITYGDPKEYGWCHPSKCDTTRMPESHAESWQAYKDAHSALRELWTLDALHGRVGTDSRVRPLIKTNAAVTGRMSIVEPAIQNHPKALRGIYLSEQGHDIVGVDHSNAELRVFARLINDPAFTRRVMTGDPYSELAAFTGRTRQDEKWRLIAWGYGISEQSLAKKVGAEQAHASVSGCLALFPQIEEWRNAQTARAKRGEALYTLTGRRVPTSDRKARDQQGTAANRIIQGTARDAFGAAVREAARLLDEAALWLPLHDELFVLSPRGAAEETAELLIQAMTVDLGEGVVLTGLPTTHRGRWGN